MLLATPDGMCSLPQSVSELTFGQQVQPCANYRGLEKASETVWYGTTPEDLPALQLANLDTAVFAACTGPDDGLADASLAVSDRKPSLANGLRPSPSVPADWWRRPARKAFGAVCTLYDSNPITKRVTGDPVADCYGLVARGNSGLLAVADGVNWGEKSRLAARVAVRAAIEHANRYIGLGDALPDTRKAVAVLLEAFTAAHSAILRANAGLTTLCLAAALPLARPPQFAVCAVNLGDTLAFLWSKTRGLREVTIGSHDVWSVRDLRDAGGALGPAREGGEPELHNLTCSLTICDPGDLLFLATDGVTDNFDPVVQRIAVPAPPLEACSNGGGAECADDNAPSAKPSLRPAERHQYALKQMERALLECELASGEMPSARELCDCFMACARAVTQAKRDLLEDPELHLRDGRRSGKPPRGSLRRDTGLAERLALAPGKLDHASVAAYEVGVFRGDQYEVYEETVAFRPSVIAPVVVAASDSGCGASPTSDSGCCSGASGSAYAAAAIRSVPKRHSCSFAPDSLSDIEFVDSDSADDDAP